MIRTTGNSEHYFWGNGCDGWHLLKSATLSVIQERMPPTARETTHYHARAQQLFYVLRGIATFVSHEEEFSVRAGESFYVQPGTRHSIRNDQDDDLHFLVISEPPAQGDRHP